MCWVRFTQNRELLLVCILGRSFAARGRKVLQVIPSEVDTKQLPQYEFGWMRTAVVVRNHAVSQHQQGS